MPSKTSKSNSENPRGTQKSVIDGDRKLAILANDMLSVGGTRKFGAPVTTTQIRYARAIMSQKPFKGQGKRVLQRAKITEKALKAYAQGVTANSALTREAKDLLGDFYKGMDAQHASNGGTNKTWARKNAAIILVILNEKPARKPASKPAKIEPVIEPTPEPAVA